MTMSYEAHPLHHGGEPELTVFFRVPKDLTANQYSELLARTEEEVKHRERVAGIIPLERVVFSAHDSESQR